MGRLIVHFRGICTHFHNIVPGVPHRVVLPNGTGLNFGLLDLPDSTSAVSYFLPPHVGVLRMEHPDDQALLTVPGVMVDGVIITSVRLAVANSRGPMQFHRDEIPRLTDYVADYVFADEVVLGGRAVAYFDLFSGTIEKYPDFFPRGVRAVIDTDGPPVLNVTRFFSIPEAAERVTPIRLPDRDGLELIVANIGPGCDDGSEGFDFLLHYMTAKGGIPRAIVKLLPGMAAPLEPVLGEHLKPHLDRLAQRVFPHEIPPSELPGFEQLHSSPNLSCSDTRYP